MIQINLNMKLKFLLILILLILTSKVYSAESDVHFGVDLGYGFADIGAEETAQTIANLSGSTVTYTYDEATFAGRIYMDYDIGNDLFAEVGYLQSGSLDAKYTLSGVTASESYVVKGVDLALGFKDTESGLFFKGGAHSSEIDGSATITISGTTYAANANASGTGYLFGGGVDFDSSGYSSRIGYTYYANMGGEGNADVGFLYYGFRF